MVDVEGGVVVATRTDYQVCPATPPGDSVSDRSRYGHCANQFCVIQECAMSKLAITMCLVSLLAGCSVHDEDRVAMAQQEAMSINAMSINAMSINAMSINALSSDVFELNYEATDGLEESELGREALRYLARCALADGQTLHFEVDGVVYQYPGVLGLAPDWVSRSLDSSEASLMSACLLSHINAYGVSVPISLRGGGLTTDASEEDLYGLHEAAFYGEAFTATPRMYVCSATDATIARDLSSYRSWRVCSETQRGQMSKCNDLGSMFIVTGACDQVCSQYTEGEGWSQCYAPDTGEVHEHTINSWLIDNL